MTSHTRRLVLRANASYLGICAAAGLLFMDLPGIYLGVGPAAQILANAPHAGIGFVEAHGLAFILSVLLWKAPPTRSWHVTGAAIGLLLGTANLLFWQLFIAVDSLAMGYVTTALHWIFVVVQSAMAMLSEDEVPEGAALHRAVTGGVIRNF